MAQRTVDGTSPTEKRQRRTLDEQSRPSWQIDERSGQRYGGVGRQRAVDPHLGHRGGKRRVILVITVDEVHRERATGHHVEKTAPPAGPVAEIPEHDHRVRIGGPGGRQHHAFEPGGVPVQIAGEQIPHGRSPFGTCDREHTSDLPH